MYVYIFCKHVSSDKISLDLSLNLKTWQGATKPNKKQQAAANPYPAREAAVAGTHVITPLESEHTHAHTPASFEDPRAGCSCAPEVFSHTHTQTVADRGTMPYLRDYRFYHSLLQAS